MKNLAKVSILVLSVFFLLAGCHDEGGGGGAQTSSNSDPDPQPNISVESFSASSESFSIRSDSLIDPLGPVETPEPTTLLLVGSGLLGLAGLRKKFKK